MAGAPEGADDGDDATKKAAGARQQSRPIKNLRRISAVSVPPLEQSPGLIDRKRKRREPGRAQARLVPKVRGGHLRCRPYADDDDSEDNDNLTDEEFGGRHPLSLFLHTRSYACMEKDRPKRTLRQSPLNRHDYAHLRTSTKNEKFVGGFLRTQPHVKLKRIPFRRHMRAERKIESSLLDGSIATAPHRRVVAFGLMAFTATRRVHVRYAMRFRFPVQRRKSTCPNSAPTQAARAPA